MKSESEIQQLIQLEGPHLGCILMRNNSGAFKDQEGRLVRFGLGNISNKSMKSSDLIGITTITITPDMIGKQVGIFTACEVKSEEWKPSEASAREKSQNDFLNWVRLRGGIGMMVNSVDQFKLLMQR